MIPDYRGDVPTWAKRSQREAKRGRPIGGNVSHRQFGEVRSGCAQTPHLVLTRFDHAQGRRPTQSGTAQRSCNPLHLVLAQEWMTRK
jgi:hypothetical protein